MHIARKREKLRLPEHGDGLLPTALARSLEVQLPEDGDHKDIGGPEGGAGHQGLEYPVPGARPMSPATVTLSTAPSGEA